MAHLPRIVDDAECEWCDQQAQPFDAWIDPPLCTEHMMEYWCEYGSDDMYIDPEDERDWEETMVQADQGQDREGCDEWFCDDAGSGRLIDNRKTFYCTKHALIQCGCPGWLLTREEFETDTRLNTLNVS